MADPKSYVDVDPVFEVQVRALRTNAAANAQAATDGTQPGWNFPSLTAANGTSFGWDGDTTKLDDMAKPFSREQANQQYIDGLVDAEKPGTTGDAVAATTQIDYLACMERAFRTRHTMPRNRAAMHAAARLAGHGAEGGVLTTCVLEYVRRLVRQSRGDTK